ncbi:uncharacterized protein DSM5745_09074 [Aspergillus mulundensis]|uniref:Uncharacterized protein n=1 Tax=Aspergillus mulundensis TaxID=1810919 RepID=A0A3D8QZU1_9EURO|nr:hypothetical protein DSM5745_09074 [Aspergillus mulundensis]RDW67208.1 hypothetical protein DSM5745_09074 [Aspergillus mulundensis]
MAGADDVCRAIETLIQLIRPYDMGVADLVNTLFTPIKRGDIHEGLTELRGRLGRAADNQATGKRSNNKEYTAEELEEEPDEESNIHGESNRKLDSEVNHEGTDTNDEVGLPSVEDANVVEDGDANANVETAHIEDKDTNVEDTSNEDTNAEDIDDAVTNNEDTNPEDTNVESNATQCSTEKRPDCEKTNSEGTTNQKIKEHPIYKSFSRVPEERAEEFNKTYRKGRHHHFWNRLSQLDSGPVISQLVNALRNRESMDALAQRLLERRLFEQVEYFETHTEVILNRGESRRSAALRKALGRAATRGDLYKIERGEKFSFFELIDLFRISVPHWTRWRNMSKPDAKAIRDQIKEAGEESATGTSATELSECLQKIYDCLPSLSSMNGRTPEGPIPSAAEAVTSHKRAANDCPPAKRRRLDVHPIDCLAILEPGGNQKVQSSNFIDNDSNCDIDEIIAKAIEGIDAEAEPRYTPGIDGYRFNSGFAIDTGPRVPQPACTDGYQNNRPLEVVNVEAEPRYAHGNGYRFNSGFVVDTDPRVPQPPSDGHQNDDLIMEALIEMITDHDNHSAPTHKTVTQDPNGTRTFSALLPRYELGREGG